VEGKIDDDGEILCKVVGPIKNGVNGSLKNLPKF
jgi:hypothetical protein